MKNKFLVGYVIISIMVSMTGIVAASGKVIADNDDKVTICHYPPGNIDNPQTITIRESALESHIGSTGHGETGLDNIGSCPEPIPPVPEFSTMILTSGGLLGLLGIARFRKN